MKHDESCYFCKGHPKHEAQRYEHEWLAKKVDEAYQRAAEATVILMEWGKTECHCSGIQPCRHTMTADWLQKEAALVQNIEKARKAGSVKEGK